MASTNILRFPCGTERSITTDSTINADHILHLRAPMTPSSADAAVAEAQRFYATHTSPDGAKLTAYRVASAESQLREQVLGKLEIIKVLTLEVVDNG